MDTYLPILKHIDAQLYVLEVTNLVYFYIYILY